MADKRKLSHMKSLHTVREHRVRLRQAVSLQAEQALNAAVMVKDQCERAVELAVEHRRQYEREVFDRMVESQQGQAAIRAAMVHLKALWVQIEMGRELVSQAQANVVVCTEQLAVARRDLAEAARAEVKVSELLDRQRIMQQREVELRQEEPS